MAKVVFLGTPAHGHVNPTRAVVRELVEMGEQITYFCGEEFRTKIEPCGASFESYESISSQDLSYSPKEAGNLFLLAAVVLEMTCLLLPALEARVRALKPDYIIHDALSVWGKSIATMLNLPAICSVTAFAFSPRMSLTSVDFTREIFRMFLSEGRALWRFQRSAQQLKHDWGLKRPGFVEALTNEESLNIVYTSSMFQPMSRAFGTSFRFVGPSVCAETDNREFPFKLPDGKNLVYISLGTIFHEDDAFYRVCFNAFQNADCFVVVSVGTKTSLERLGPSPANFCVQARVPQLQVLSRAGVFVTHGGMNSVSESLLCGVPMVVIPRGADQYAVADRVRKLRAGVRLRRSQATAASLRSAVEQLLRNGTYRENCRLIGDSLRAAGGPRRAAEEIVRFTKKYTD